MSSRTASILANMVTTLQAMNGSAPYQNLVNFPTRQVEDVDGDFSGYADDAYPHFSIVGISEERNKEIGHLYNKIFFQVVCTFKNLTGLQIASWVSDIEVALAQDITRGGYAIETWVPRIDRDSGAFSPFQVYVMTVEVHTIFNYNDPS